VSIHPALAHGVSSPRWLKQMDFRVYHSLGPYLSGKKHQWPQIPTQAGQPAQQKLSRLSAFSLDGCSSLKAFKNSCSLMRLVSDVSLRSAFPGRRLHRCEHVAWSVFSSLGGRRSVVPRRTPRCKQRLKMKHQIWPVNRIWQAYPPFDDPRFERAGKRVQRRSFLNFLRQAVFWRLGPSLQIRSGCDL
jgi:hypothetical protein